MSTKQKPGFPPEAKLTGLISSTLSRADCKVKKLPKSFICKVKKCEELRVNLCVSVHEIIASDPAQEIFIQNEQGTC